MEGKEVGEEGWRQDWTSTPDRGAPGEEIFPHSEGPTHSEGISGDGEGLLRDHGIRGESGQDLPCVLGPQRACWAQGLGVPKAHSSHTCPGPESPTKPPLALQVQEGQALPPFQGSSCCAGPCGHACGGLHPSWPTQAHVLQASFRSRCW